MRLVDFISRFNRNKATINSSLVIRSNPKENLPSYYFRNVPLLNELFRELYRQSSYSLPSFEAFFLKHLPECLSQISWKTTEPDASNTIKSYFQSLF